MEPDRAAIPEADGIPAARLADDAIVRSVPRGNGSGAGRAEALPADRADDGDCRAEIGGSGRGRGDKGAEGSLGIDGAAAPQLAVLNANGDVPGDRVDVAEQDDPACPRADGSNGIAGGVDL